jgi:hypothetical protein
MILEASLGAFLALTLLSYPFFVKFLFHSAYQAMVFGGFVLVGFLTIVWGKLPTSLAIRSPLPATFLVLYGLYLLSLGVASFVNAGEGYSLPPMVRALMKFSFCLMVLTQLRWEVHKWLLSRYVDILLVTSLLALLLLPVALLGLMDPLFELELATASGQGSVRNVYPLGMTWGGIWLGEGRVLARLQSFADEPGTYAFALLPAIAWSIAQHRWVALCVLFAALMGTLSVGAIPVGAIVVAVLLWRHVRSGKRIVLATGASILVLLPVLFLLPQTSFLSGYLATKLGSGGESTTSVGQRIGDLQAALEIISRSPWGLGAGSLGTAFKVPIGVGFGEVLGDAGFLGLALYCSASVLLSAMAARILFFEDPERSAVGAAVLALCAGALQRARWDESFWHWWIVAAAILAFHKTKPTSS